MVKKNAGKRESQYAKMQGRKEYITTSYIDFIAYDFLYQIKPQPEIFEIKQVLKIPKTRIEERHELMLSMIRDRIQNKERYEKEYFSKYSKWYDTRQKGSKYMIYGIGRTTYERRKFSICKHKENLKILMSLYRHVYFGYKWLSYAIEPFDMHRLERLPDPESQQVYAEAERILTAEAKATGQRVKEPDIE